LFINKEIATVYKEKNLAMTKLKRYSGKPDLKGNAIKKIAQMSDS
jgi:hypothetical protein